MTICCSNGKLYILVARSPVLLFDHSLEKAWILALLYKSTLRDFFQALKVNLYAAIYGK